MESFQRRCRNFNGYRQKADRGNPRSALLTVLTVNAPQSNGYRQMSYRIPRATKAALTLAAVRSPHSAFAVATVVSAAWANVVSGV